MARQLRKTVTDKERAQGFVVNKSYKTGVRPLTAWEVLHAGRRSEPGKKRKKARKKHVEN